MHRRTFVHALGAAVSTGPLASLISPTRRLNRIGLELYSVRDAMGRDPERTLAAVRAMGYTDVELLWSFGNFGRTTEQVRAALDHEGLRAPSAHVSPTVVLVGWERSLAIAQRLGHEYLIVPSFTADTARSLDDWREWADRFNTAGAAARRAGIWLAFHNEADHMTPIDGKVPYDVFVERTDPSVKDVVKDRSHDTELGTGTLDFRRLLASIPDLDHKPCYVEQEGVEHPLDNARHNQAYLSKLEF